MASLGVVGSSTRRDSKRLVPTLLQATKEIEGRLAKLVDTFADPRPSLAMVR